ncbi:MAG TPA: LytTR family DNA-binding domain-containing protein [Haliscomenobacter sp.]|uniref:LytR/AlgR family response regulator transcription factor n=1 Tax=Haliscomenobacter sp. TaxID=2717303 RepID=UPI002BA12460|nr:LytTR family DNA-binding domain-containing protein [Haliscomenobacter sp.]HOY21053.1 LytTR family DNA-binding domain-containing protein [Haliscomenobacter sp.]HPH20297.1 LytTR family DNA-binding domain-containing protein [Haliscomenobacter sp.]
MTKESSLKIFIVEDERLGLERLIKLLHELDPSIEVLGHAETVKSTVWWLQNNPAPDLLLLDIELADGQCFEIFRQIDVQVPVIFTTSYDEYALNAFKVNSVDYLLKPIRKEELAQSLAKLQRLKTLYVGKESALNVDKLIASLSSFQPPQQYRKRFLVKQGQKLQAIEVEEIAWFTTDSKICFLRTWENQRYVLDYSLEELSTMLNPDLFFRVNRSYIVHIKAIKVINSYFNGKLQLQLSPAPEQNDVIISKEKAAEFKKWMGK